MKSSDLDERADQARRLVSDILEAAGALRRRGDAIAAAAGQNQARWQVLSVLSDGDWTVSKAARRLGVRRQSVQRVADALLAQGLLRAEPNPHHARSPLLRLTPEGQRALATVTDVADPWHERLAAQLSLDDLRTARDALRIVVEAARDRQPPAP